MAQQTFYQPSKGGWFCLNYLLCLNSRFNCRLTTIFINFYVVEKKRRKKDIRISADASRRMYYFLLTIIITSAIQRINEASLKEHCMGSTAKSGVQTTVSATSARYWPEICIYLININFWHQCQNNMYLSN